jgi:hypothetical protein
LQNKEAGQCPAFFCANVCPAWRLFYKERKRKISSAKTGVKAEIVVA